MSTFTEGNQYRTYQNNLIRLNKMLEDKGLDYKIHDLYELAVYINKGMKHKPSREEAYDFYKNRKNNRKIIYGIFYDFSTKHATVTDKTLQDNPKLKYLIRLSVFGILIFKDGAYEKREQYARTVNYKDIEREKEIDEIDKFIKKEMQTVRQKLMPSTEKEKTKNKDQYDYKQTQQRRSYSDNSYDRSEERSQKLNEQPVKNIVPQRDIPDDPQTKERIINTIIENRLMDKVKRFGNTVLKNNLFTGIEKDLSFDYVLFDHLLIITFSEFERDFIERVQEYKELYGKKTAKATYSLFKKMEKQKALSLTQQELKTVYDILEEEFKNKNSTNRAKWMFFGNNSADYLVFTLLKNLYYRKNNNKL